MAGQWSALPPEVNAGQLMAGDQGASIAAAAAAYEALAAALMAEGAKMAATAGVTASTGWVGVGGTAMMATAMPYVAALELLAGWVQQSAASAAGIEQAYVTAKMGMIPVPACSTNRSTWVGLANTNFCGINLPPMGVLDAQYYGHFWNNNAGLMGGYEGIVSAILVTLGIPPPPAPLTANPAGPAGQAAAISQAAASGATSAAMSQSLSGVNQAAGAVQPGAQTAAAPAQSMASMAPQMMSQLGQLPQMAAQPLQMLGQFPQMLGQMPQMAMGMLGPLTQGMGGGWCRRGRHRQGRPVRPDGAGGHHRCCCTRGRWRRCRRPGRRRRIDVQLHQAHRQFQCTRSSQAADWLDAGSRCPGGRRIGKSGSGRRRGRTVRRAGCRRRCRPHGAR